MIELKKVLEWLKLSGKQALILFVITSIMLFAHDDIIEKLGLVKAKENLQVWLGLVWLISVAVLLAELIFPLYKWVVKKVRWRINLKTHQKRLHNLTFEEKQLLLEYVANNTRTRSASCTNGVVTELEAEKIIRRSSNMSQYHDVFPYNIQPWAWNYLNENPHLLQ